MKGRRRAATGFLAALMILLAAAAVLLTVLGIQKKRYQEQLSLGDKYLAELDYENAEICFEKAISIQEKKAAPYLKLAAVYLYQGRTQDAENILREGSQKVTDNEGLENIRENLEILEEPKGILEGYVYDEEKPFDSSSIPIDAVSFNGHYYYVYELDTVTTWEEAKQYCEEQGGYLAAITSAEENDFVYSCMKNSFGYESAYFGFTDREEEGTWVWENGEVSTYTNWHSGEPNGENPKEDFAMYYYKYSDGTWNDGDFGKRTVNSKKVFICEWGE